MTSSQLNLAVDNWTIQSVLASRFLLRLYRALGDGKQANNAIRAGHPAEERASRLRLEFASREALGAEGSGALGEADAWRILVESQAGICAFHAMADSHPEGGKSLKGARNSATKAFERAVQGYRVAFPELDAKAGIRLAVEGAAATCAETFIADLSDDDPEEDREALRRELYREIFDALSAATKTVEME